MKIIKLSEKEINALLAAEFVLRKSREVRYGGTYVEHIKDYEHSRKIPFEEANEVLSELLDRVLEGEVKDNG